MRACLEFTSYTRNYNGVESRWLVDGLRAGSLLDRHPNISAGTLSEVEAMPGMEWLQFDWGQVDAGCGAWCAQKVDSDGVAAVVPLMCGKWTCCVCGKLREWWFKRNVNEWHGAYNFVGFWTLTIQHQGLTALESWELVKKSWGRLKRRMDRAGYDCEFIWVAEPQPRSGYCHLHVLIDRYIPWEWVQANWEEVTGGAKVVRVDPIHDGAPARYMAKYMSKVKNHDKLVPGYEALKGKRMFSTSGGITFDTFKKSSGKWEVVYLAFKEYMKHALHNGDVVAANVRGAPAFLVRDLPGGPIPGRGNIGVLPESNVLEWARREAHKKTLDKQAECSPPGIYRSDGGCIPARGPRVNVSGADASEHVQLTWGGRGATLSPAGGRNVATQ